MKRKRKERPRQHRRNPRYTKQWIKAEPRWNGERIKREFNSSASMGKKVS